MRERFRGRADGDIAVQRAIHSERSEARDGEAGSLRNAAALQQIERLARHHHRHDAEHGDVDVLADSGALRLMDGRQYADHSEQRRREIRERHADAHRRIMPGRRMSSSPRSAPE